LTLVVDSSVWIEIAFGGPLAQRCESALARNQVFVPSLVIFEVYKKVKTSIDEAMALEVVGAMSIHSTTELTREVALLAADLAIEYRLAMADSIVLAHARQLSARLLTLDNDFASIPETTVLRASRS